MKTLIITLLTSLSLTLLSLDLQTARSKGLVKELPSGYIEATDPSAKGLASEVNSKRKKAYQQIAEKNKISIDIVGQQAAKKIQQKISN